jgi:archaellum component FlaF (FlaF/FlaG flagellin family)
MIINNMNEQPTSQPTQSNANKNRKVLKIVVIVLVSILAVAAIGYSIYAWQQNTRLQDDLAQQAQESKKLAEENADLKKAAEKSAGSNTGISEGVIKLVDWKVEFTLTDVLLNTEVKYEASTSGDMSAYDFTTSRIQGLGGACLKDPFGNTVILSRFKEKPEAIPHGELVNPGPIDGYYYVYSSPIASCSGVDENGSLTGSPSAIETTDRAALVESLKSLKAIQ